MHHGSMGVMMFTKVTSSVVLPSLREGNRDERLAAYRDLREYFIRRLEQRFTLDGL